MARAAIALVARVVLAQGRMSLPASPAADLSRARRARRRWLAGGLLALIAQRALGEAAAQRLRFRSRRAVCDCAGDLDDEAIERALAERRGQAAAASEPAASAASKGKPGSTTTRRSAP